MSRKWGPGWREEMIETDTSPVSNQRSCGAQFKAGMGQTSKLLLELCHLSLPPPTFSKERKKEKRGGRGWGGWGRLNENQTQPCLVWMRAVGRMMSQIWGGIFSLLFHTFDHFSIYVCGALSLVFQQFGDFAWFSVLKNVRSHRAHFPLCLSVRLKWHLKANWGIHWIRSYKFIMEMD